MRRLDTKGLSIACWSLCVVGKHTSGWFSQLWEEVVARWAGGRLQLTSLNGGQIYQACAPILHCLQGLCADHKRPHVPDLACGMLKVVRTLQLEGAPDLQWTPAAQDLAAKALRLQAAYLQENRASFTVTPLPRQLLAQAR